METLSAVGTAIATAAPYIATAASVASAGLGIVQGFQASQAARLERQQFQEEGDRARLAADQDELIRRRRLASVLSLNDALRGARGLSMGTGSERALYDANIEEAEEDISTARSNRLAAARRAEFGAYGASLRERAGLFSGAGAFASGLGTAATGLYRYGGVTSPSGGRRGDDLAG